MNVATPHGVLRKYFGYENFRPGQSDIVNSILEGQDTLAILPTGGGKSLCYQVPGLLFSETTLVVSPLISLMKDQVDQLTRRGILATYINSSLTTEEQNIRLASLAQAKYQFVYVSPERLQSEQFVKICQQVSLPFIAVDEAHCISQWGHDFRPEYQQITQFIAQLSRRPVILAVTATATPQVQTEIVHSLQLSKPRYFLRSFERTNLQIMIYRCRTPTIKLLKLLLILKKHRGQRGIIYCPTRSKTEEVAAILKLFGYHCEFYHGGMTSEARATIQHNYSTGEILLIAATNAFGMGVDIPDVRFVIHLHVPQNLEGYYQEIGRGGRDGHLAVCYVLYTESDLTLQQELFADQTSHLLLFSRRYLTQKLCRHQALLNYFGEKKTTPCQRCDICLRNTVQDIFPAERQKLQELLRYRDSLAQQLHQHPQDILSGSAAQLIAVINPQTPQEFLAIPGIGRGWVETYASLFIQRTATP